ncbi:hypothetical protein Scep_001411 [Stephania cephalantha]|uniref:UBA domain-containing protein n=1 Tax=Stephania cephalantha TaxID=152367 RepID=A0AAP0L907_9MAGN
MNRNVKHEGIRRNDGPGTGARAERSRDAPRRPPSSVDDLLGILDETSVSKGKNDKEQSGGQSSGATRGSTPQPPDFEAKVAKLTELGFGRDAVIQALQLFNGNELEPL